MASWSHPPSGAMTSSIGPVVSCENTVNGNPPYITKTKNPNDSCVAGAYPKKRKKNGMKEKIKGFVSELCKIPLLCGAITSAAPELRTPHVTIPGSFAYLQ